MNENIELNSFEFLIRQKIYFFFKRILDVLFSIIGLIAFVIVFIIIKIAYLFHGDTKPLLYKHKRVGKNGKIFYLYKFRTMIVDADDVLKEMLENEETKKEWLENRKLKNDPRITKAGEYFRKHSMDEFPQFINVLKGDMSIIGPRPLVEGELQSQNGSLIYEKICPGISGWWACNGRSDTPYKKRLELEYYYIKHVSLWLDTVCFFKTIYVMLFKKGAE